jgi:hypothetical protein
VNQLSTPTKITLIGIFLLAVVVVTALLDISFHFDKFVVIAIMLVATVIGAYVLTEHNE